MHMHEEGRERERDQSMYITPMFWRKNSKRLPSRGFVNKSTFWSSMWMNSRVRVLGLVPLNPIVWCYVWYYVWHYVWHDVWLNIVINKFVLLLSEIMVTWIFRHYHIVHEMHSMWFMWKVTEDINHKFFVSSKF